MLTRLDLRGATGDLAGLLPRPAAAKDLPTAAVQAIIADVRLRGDGALRELTERFDGPALDDLKSDQGSGISARRPALADQGSGISARRSALGFDDL